jgi:hypothetical protein
MKEINNFAAFDNIQLSDQEKLQRKYFYELLKTKEEEEKINEGKDKSDKRRRYTREEYFKLIDQLEEISEKKSRKTSHEYYILNNYEILVICDTKKIIKKRKTKEDPILFLVPYEDYFDYLLLCHKEIDHKARDFMAAYCSKRFINLTIELICCNNLSYLIFL